MYLVLLLSVVWCLYYIYTKFKKSKHKLPPCYPGALPIIGHNHLFLLHANDLFGFLTSITNFCLKAGGVSVGYFGGDLYYGIVDPEDAVTVMNSLLQKHYLYKVARPWIGQGLITSSGALYKRHRRILSPAFSLSAIYGFLDVFNDQSRRLTEILESHIGKGPFDCSSMFRNITLRTSCITVFGDNDEKDNSFLNTYIKTVDELCESVMERILKVWLHNDFLFKYSKLKKHQDKLMTTINEIANEVLQRKKIDSKYTSNYCESENDEKRTFIDVILADMKGEGALTDEEIIEELNTTVAASFETTSQQLSFITVFLGSYPEVQDKIYKEVIEVVGDRDIEKQDISKLVYTEAVIKECLRLIPAIPLIPRYVDKDLKLKNYTLRAGTNVFIMPGGIHRHPVWGPDVDEFKPERWLDKDTQSKLASLSFSFSFGPRSCIGRKYAMVSIKVALAHMVRQIRLKSDISKIKYKIDIVTRPRSGHEITVERRSMKHDYNQNIPLSIFNERKDAFYDSIKIYD